MNSYEFHYKLQHTDAGSNVRMLELIDTAISSKDSYQKSQGLIHNACIMEDIRNPDFPAMLDYYRTAANLALKDGDALLLWGVPQAFGRSVLSHGKIGFCGFLFIAYTRGIYQNTS